MHAYGLDVDLAVLNPVTGPLRLPWHHVALARHEVTGPTTSSVSLGPHRARLDTGRGLSVRVSRSEAGAVASVDLVGLSQPSDDEVAHPLLTFVASVISRWTGRTALHGASVVLHGRAWILLAPPGGGKSTVSSALDARGHPVLADDLAVIEGRTVLAGPRSCDLREAAFIELGRGVAVDDATGRDRWRQRLAPAPAEVPLGGLLALEWSDALSSSPLPVSDRLRLLASHEALAQGPSRPEAFLDLLDLPMLRLQRPRSWEALTAVCEHVEAVTCP